MEKKISIESLIKSINQEIDWSEENKDMVSEEYAKGFIKGLEQVIHILKQIEEVGESKLKDSEQYGEERIKEKIEKDIKLNY